jgi:hypothetical protein
MRLRPFQRDFFRASRWKWGYTLKTRLSDSLRSDCRQGAGPLRGTTLVPSSASLTASSLRLRFLYGSWRSPPLPNATLTIATEEGSC